MNFGFIRRKIFVVVVLLMCIFTINTPQGQRLLHQAIVDDSAEDIRKSLEMGANVNLGVGNQPPLLLAILSKKYKAAQELINNNANPNLFFRGKSIFFLLSIEGNIDFINSLFEHGLKLSEKDRQAAIDRIAFQANSLNDQKIKTLQFLNYDVKNFFNDTDLTKNKWYQLLVKRFSGARRDALRNAGLPNIATVRLFLKYGANPNEIFIENKKGCNAKSAPRKTPLLLIIDNYILAIKRNKRNRRGHSFSYKKQMTELVKVLLESGANINQAVPCLRHKKEAAPLLAFVFWNSGHPYAEDLINFLVANGASLEKGIDCFLKANLYPDTPINLNSRAGKTTLLLLAVENNCPNAVKLLIKAGAHCNSNHPAFNFAMKNGYGEIIELILRPCK